MPSLVPSRRTHSSDDESDEQDDAGDTNSGNSTPASSNSSNKRARVEPDNPEVDDSWILSPPAVSQPSQPVAHRARPAAAAISHRDSGVALNDGPGPVRQEHNPGAIVRVSLENFVTYTKVSFHPGPNLNMVIGPNGTGKSTLVCAICLGLGWSSEPLGRAKNVNEFVKHGCEEGSIEIELKGNAGERNPIIRRVIKREGNKSVWTVDGKASNQKGVRRVAERFSIQVDNLCQFLPQDRVVEFSAMSPKELLQSTQRAAAGPEMAEWHEQLQTLRSNQKKAETEKGSWQNNLTALETRQNSQRADVEQMRERDMLATKLKLMKKCKPFVQIGPAQQSAAEAKRQYNIASAQLQNLEDELAPRMAAIEDKAAYREAVEKAMNAKINFHARLTDKFAGYKSAHTESKSKLDKLDGDKKSYQKTYKANNDAILKQQNQAEDLRKLKDVGPPPELDTADFNERIRDKNRRAKHIGENVEDLRQRAETMSKQITDREDERRASESELGGLENRKNQLLKKLSGLSQDTYKAWEWIERNRRVFKGTVYGPPLMECSVKDMRYADCIESSLSRSDFTIIVCTELDDFKLLNSQLLSQLKLADVSLRRVTRPLSDYRPPLNQEEMERLDLDGWVLDFLQGPEPVLSALCSERRIHATPVRLRNSDEAHFEKMQRSTITQWLTSDMNYSIKKRAEYGDAGTSTTSKHVKPANIWKEDGVDPGQQRRLQETMRRLTSEIEELQAERTRVEENRKTEAAAQSKLAEEASSLKTEKEELQKKHAEWSGLETKISSAESMIKQLESTNQEKLEQLESIWEKRVTILEKMADSAIEYSRTVESLRDQHAAVVATQVMLIEAESDLEALNKRNEDAYAAIDTYKKQKKKLEKEKQRLKEAAKKVTEACRKIRENEPDVADFWMQLPEDDRPLTVEQYETDLGHLETRLGLLPGGDPRILRDFEKREKDIEALRTQLADKDASLAELEEEMTSIRQQWEPRLDALIGQISAAFSASFARIDCAGEVKIHRAGEGGRDFEDWAVQICVRFREAETMSVLDSHRQSGGERAVSTVFYLMALQSLSRAPFRVVDEINQGMDPRNERIVHERIVDIACGGPGGSGSASNGAAPNDDQRNENNENNDNTTHGPGSQYFLITPKLLTNLKYRPGMTVHCIASGEQVPQDPARLDFAALLARARQLRLGRERDGSGSGSGSGYARGEARGLLA